MKTHVDVNDEAPAGNPGECFWCKENIGQEHKWECPVPTKTVLVKSTFTYEVEVPRSWDAHNVWFHRNESSSCADNILRDLERYAEKVGCLCGHQQTEFIDEAKESE